MLTKDVRFEGWTTEDWSRFLSLWKVPAEIGGAPRGGLIVIHSQGRLRKILHTTRGRIEKEGIAWPYPLAALAAEHGARWVLASPTGGLENIAERFGARCRQEDDLASQARLMLAILRELVEAGIIAIWPNRIERLSLPSGPFFEHTFEAVYPPGEFALVALFHEGELFTSIALERGKGGISRMVGPMAADAAIWAAAAANSLGRRWESLALLLSQWQRRR